MDWPCIRQRSNKSADWRITNLNWNWKLVKEGYDRRLQLVGLESRNATRPHGGGKHGVTPARAAAKESRGQRKELLQ